MKNFKTCFYISFTLMMLFSVSMYSAINVSIDANITTGVAPLAVHFDASATTATNVSKPFHHLEYTWNFGDSYAGTYAVNGKSLNEAKGAIAAHVFDEAGQYTVTLTVYSSYTGETETELVTINVIDPDSYYNGTNTICFSSSGDFSGAPSGSQHVTLSDIGNLNSYMASNTRFLLKRGDTFSCSNTISIVDVHNVTIGAFGTGTSPDSRGMYSNAPYINNVAVNMFYFSSWDTSLLASHLRIMDLKVRSTSTTVTFTDGLECPYLLLYKLDVEGFASGIFLNDGLITWYNENGDPGHEYFPETFVVNCNVHNTQSWVMYASLTKAGIINNRFWECADSHILRFPLLIKGFVSGNEIGYQGVEDLHLIKMHALTFLDSEQNIVSDNYFETDRSNWAIAIAPQYAGVDEQIKDIIFERNYVTATDMIQVGVYVASRSVTVRNNVINGYGITFHSAVHVVQRGIEPAPDDIEIYNNSFWVDDNGIDVYNGSNITIRNNLQYMGDNLIGMYVPVTHSNNILAASNPYISSSPSSGYDFQLHSSSSGIDAGMTLNSVYHDYAEVARSIPFDVGAFNYTGSPVSVTGVILNQDTLILAEGQNANLTETVLPANATDQTVTWSSNDTTVATVNSSGLVTAVAEGSTTVMVTTNDGGFTDECSIIVSNITIPVTGVALDQNSLNLNEGESSDLTETVSPTNATDQTVYWSSTDTMVATVNSNGLVTAVTEGLATITVTTNDGGFTDNCSVTVSVSDIPLGYTYNCDEGETVNVTGTMNIAYGANGQYYYLYNQTTSVGCNNETFGDPIYGVAKSCYVQTVGSIPVTGVILDQNSLNLNIGESSDLTETVSPTNATDQTVSWSSNDTMVVTVNSNGLVIAVAEGSATITVTTNDGGFTDNCSVTVSASGIPLGYTYSCDEGETVNVTGTVNIAYGANGQYNYLYNQTTSVGCSNEVFGDPIYGVFKSCYVQSVDMMAAMSISLNSEIIGETEKAAIRIYPNPLNHSQLYIDLGETNFALISIIDINGKILYKKQNTGIIKLPRNLFSNGLYIIQVKTEDSVINHKLNVID